MQQSHITAAQFGSAAADYLTSAVHARGADLDELAQRFAKRSQACVLDIGCGAGHATYAIAPHVREVHAYDLAEPMVALVARTAHARGLHNVHTRQGAAEMLPFPAQSFDAIVSRLSAHHWRNVPAALSEMQRVLRPGGCVVLIDSMGASDPLCDSHLQTIELLRDRSHVRNYTLAEWQRFFSTAGFTTLAAKTWRLHIDYASWIARMHTPPERASAIKEVWQHAPEEVRTHFAVRDDGSFDLEVLQIAGTIA